MGGAARARALDARALCLVGVGGARGRSRRDACLELSDDRQHRVDFELTFWRRNARSYPFLYADQDVLNAILSTGGAGDRLEALEQRLAATPPFRGLRIADVERLDCRYRDGAQPFVLHQYVRKPWLEATYDGTYSRLLRRLLVGRELALRPAEDQLPTRMRTGGRARAERACVNALDFLRWHLGDRLPEPVATRVEDRRRARAASER